MNIKTYRAKSMQQALDLVRRELGPEAVVLHTRVLNGGLLGRVIFGRQYEVAAAGEAIVPAVMTSAHLPTAERATTELEELTAVPVEANYRDVYRQHLHDQPATELDELRFMSERLRHRSDTPAGGQLSEGLFQIYTDLIEADVDEDIAQGLLRYLRSETSVDIHDIQVMKQELLQAIEADFRTTGPLEVSSEKRRVVALVGPTGVGKTTTIAKLAANYRLREKRSVGLITVDTYRIAAVEQLRTYADIIDLPMEVVSTPREMREAVARMRSLDLVLMDTAGRSPRDQIRIQELKSMLSEAAPDEVHLVLSAAGSARNLTKTVEQFSSVGTTAIVVTKLDEASGLGNVLSLARSCGLPLSYLTDGQNVPDDIRVAESHNLAEMVLGMA